MVSIAAVPASRVLLLVTLVHTVFGQDISETSEWKYPYPPWTFPGEVWAFFGTHLINGSHPPDFVPDPDISYAPSLFPSTIFIVRFADSFWGPWDALVIMESTARIGNGPGLGGRLTQAFTNAVPPTQPNYPFHVPYRLAKFAWTTRADGGRDLQVYYPPASTRPVISITGLFTIPFLCLPIPRGVFFCHPWPDDVRAKRHRFV
eukprot:jgi/Botrbrau1/12761/Bobra.67_1s0120.1